MDDVIVIYELYLWYGMFFIRVLRLLFNVNILCVFYDINIIF